MAPIRSDYLKQKNRRFNILPPGHISAVLLSNSGTVPLANTSVILMQTSRRLEATTDSDGLVSFDNIPIGEYKLELPEFNAVVVVPSVPTDVEKVPVCVAGYELFGKDAPDQPEVEADDTDSSEVISKQVDDEGWSRAQR